ncbi:hypothetical protein [Saccharothrix deserti]|uniref:hypothetical protein n=1 Tax=Saccharothrix deserti TaxID=2593674 RepID=UPI00131BDC96|nr:hypothetical protein [Saccharothrix deserti]
MTPQRRLRDTHRPGAPEHVVAFEAQVAELGRVLRRTNSFTRAAAQWLGRPISYRLVGQERRSLAVPDARALSVPIGTLALHRWGFVSAQIDADPVTGSRRAVATVVAEVRSAVLEDQVDDAARQALSRGDVPLGEVFTPAPVERVTRAVERLDDVDEFGSRVLRVSAILLVSGCRVAAVQEVAYRQLLEHAADGGRESG